jgi:glycosyltransferase involved in cell wall biosynthesis
MGARGATARSGNFGKAIMPRISILTPVYNGAGYMQSCLENVASQRFDDLEHIILDGDSTDGTTEIARTFAATHPNVRIISEKDAGQSDAMNKGVRLAAAPIIGMLNVDDFYEPGAVDEAVRFLEDHPEADFVAGDCNMRDEHGTIERVNRPRDLRLEKLLLGWEIAEYPVNPSAYFYRKAIHSVVGDYLVSEHFAMDVCFIYACAAKTRMVYQPRLWGNFRHLPGTKTVQNRDSAPRMMRKLRYKHIGMLPLRRRIPLTLKSLVLDAKRAYWEFSKNRA